MLNRRSESGSLVYLRPEVDNGVRTNREKRRLRKTKGRGELVRELLRKLVLKIGLTKKIP